jgi:hypothetical protein
MDVGGTVTIARGAIAFPSATAIIGCARLPAIVGVMMMFGTNSKPLAGWLS